MQTRKQLLRIAAAALVCTAILASCSGGKIGYGVVLWSPEKSNLKTGEVVTVKSQSQLNNTYSVTSSKGAAAVTLPVWRIKLFSSEKDAANYSVNYTPMVPILARATVNGAPIRDKPEIGATRLYRLRKDQVIKVLAKQQKKVTIDGISGYWYEVLTSDGVQGYSFDSNLQVYNPANQTQQQQSVSQLLLNKVLATTFRPQYFDQMITSKRIDLSRFEPKYGFFADTKKKTLRIEMPKYTLNFDYTAINEVGPNDYTFSGTPVELIIQDPNTIQLQYSDSKGNQYDQTFVNIKQDIGLLVSQERNRRLKLYTAFLDKTPLSSDYYGKIDLHADMGFQWSGYTRLVPNIIPSGAGSTGAVDFALYLDSSLAGSYDGVITFTFGAQPTGTIDPKAGATSTQSTAQAATSTGSAAPSPGTGRSSTATSAGTSGGTSGSTPSSQGGATSSASTASAVQQPTANTQQESVSFLYRFVNGGVKFTYAPPSTIDKDVVTSVSSTPINIFFSFK